MIVKSCAEVIGCARQVSGHILNLEPADYVDKDDTGYPAAVSGQTLSAGRVRPQLGRSIRHTVFPSIHGRRRSYLNALQKKALIALLQG